MPTDQLRDAIGVVLHNTAICLADATGDTCEATCDEVADTIFDLPEMVAALKVVEATKGVEQYWRGIAKAYLEPPEAALMGALDEYDAVTR